MTPEEREAFYDSEIAPALLELAGKCEANGLSIVAVVEWAPGDTGTTAAIREGSGVGLRMTHLAAQARGNADSLIAALVRYGREHGHNSMFLHKLGAD